MPRTEDGEPDADADADEVEDEADAVSDVCVPIAELCDGIDNDCDGDTDETFDFPNDIDHCGRCEVSCRDLPHAIASCSVGRCRIDACLTGWVDSNGQATDGCEYACTPTLAAEGTREACMDGVDNDCDGRTDASDPDCSSDWPEVCNGVDDDCDGSTDEGLWCPVPVPVVDPPVEDLWAIWGAAANDVWVVGRWGVVLHWDGADWSIVPLGTASHLYAVYGIASDDVWAVGQGVFRWDGATWSRMPSPPGSAELKGVWGSSPDDIWVVGGGLFRWNGATWTVETVPGWEDLRGIWGFAADDIWAVGMDPPVGAAAVILIHWDGTAWSRFRPPSAPGLEQAEDVWGISPDDVWAACRVGHLLHWDGTRWSDGPYGSSATGTFYYGVWGFSSGDVWAVGSSPPGSSNAAHWDGTSWLPAGPLGTDGLALRDVWGASPAEIWAVGDAAAVFRWRE